MSTAPAWKPRPSPKAARSAITSARPPIRWWRRAASCSPIWDRASRLASRSQRQALYELPDYVPRKNKSNHYGFDPHEQAHSTFTGMGADINVHDQWACESMGAIQDRGKEHLGQSDKAISAYRRLLRGAIAAAGSGGRPPMLLDAAAMTGPAAIDGIGPSEDWQTYWQKTDANRRQASSWEKGR
jgi:hypothetical protein